MTSRPGRPFLPTLNPQPFQPSMNYKIPYNIQHSVFKFFLYFDTKLSNNTPFIDNCRLFNISGINHWTWTLVIIFLNHFNLQIFILLLFHNNFYVIMVRFRGAIREMVADIKKLKKISVSVLFCFIKKTDNFPVVYAPSLVRRHICRVFWDEVFAIFLRGRYQFKFEFQIYQMKRGIQ